MQTTAARPTQVRHFHQPHQTFVPPGNLLIFADDWGRHPSSAQHLITHLLPRHDIGWVNTIGTRPPRLDWKTASRAVEKFGEWNRPRPAATTNAPAPEILAPRMWPWFRRSLDRALNQRLLERSLRPWINGRTGPVTAVTTLPIVADLVGALPVDRWIYYCVDDFSTWPGLDAEPLRQMERELVSQVDRVIAVSESLKTRLAAHRDDVSLLPHGVDLAHWQSAPAISSPIADYPGPRIVFWGLVDQRLDLELLSRLAHDLTEGTILLIGPEDNPDPRLAEIPRVQRVPAIPLEDLPAVARDADLLIMPYADLPVTRMMQPLKLLEYLATGLPVLVRALPAVDAWRDCLDAAATPAEFSRLARERLQMGLPPSQSRARNRLTEESWSAKAHQFERLVFA